MKLDHVTMAKHLKTLIQNPAKIEQQQRRLQEKLNDIARREATGNYAPNALAKERQEAIAERDRTCNALCDAMRPALDYVRANNNYEANTIDLDNPRLDKALRIVDMMGKSMNFSDQAQLVNEFKGDPASLRLMETALRKKGMTWAADNAHQMQTPISQQTLDEMNEVLAFNKYGQDTGRFQCPLERATWTRHNFQRQAEKLGYNLDDVDSNPFNVALDNTLENLLNQEDGTAGIDDPTQQALERARISAKRYKIQNAKAEISKAEANGEDPASIFNKALMDAEQITTADAAGIVNA